MNASYYGIKSFYNQLTPQPYDQARFTNLMNIPHLRALMGARYVLCGPTYSPTDAGAKQILEIEGYRLFENANAMGRLTLVHRAAGLQITRVNSRKLLRRASTICRKLISLAMISKAARQSLSKEVRVIETGNIHMKELQRPRRGFGQCFTPTRFAHGITCSFLIILIFPFNVPNAI